MTALKRCLTVSALCAAAFRLPACGPGPWSGEAVETYLRRFPDNCPGLEAAR